MNISINECDHHKREIIQERSFQDRRKHTDKWTYLLHSLAIVSWGLFFIALATVYTNKPQVSYLSHYLYEILWSSAFTSYLCLVMAKHRSRRKKDNKHFHIVMLLTVVFTWVTYLLTGIQ